MRNVYDIARRGGDQGNGGSARGAAGEGDGAAVDLNTNCYHGPCMSGSEVLQIHRTHSPPREHSRFSDGMCLQDETCCSACLKTSSVTLAGARSGSSEVPIFD